MPGLADPLSTYLTTRLRQHENFPGQSHPAVNFVCYYTLRLRRALIAYGQSPNRNTPWPSFIGAFRQELEAALSWFAIASLQGEVLHVPYLLRKLAATYVDISSDMVLDLSESDTSLLNQPPDDEDVNPFNLPAFDYAYDWWNSVDSNEAITIAPLDPDDLMAAMRFHCEEIQHARTPYPRYFQSGPRPRASDADIPAASSTFNPLGRVDRIRRERWMNFSRQQMSYVGRRGVARDPPSVEPCSRCSYWRGRFNNGSIAVQESILHMNNVVSALAKNSESLGLQAQALKLVCLLSEKLGRAPTMEELNAYSVHSPAASQFLRDQDSSDSLSINPAISASPCQLDITADMSVLSVSCSVNDFPPDMDSPPGGASPMEVDFVSTAASSAGVAMPRSSQPSAGHSTSRSSEPSAGGGISRPTQTPAGDGISRPIQTPAEDGISRHTQSSAGIGIYRPPLTPAGDGISRPTQSSAGNGISRRTQTPAGDGISRPTQTPAGDGISRPTQRPAGDGISRHSSRRTAGRNLLPSSTLQPGVLNASAGVANGNIQYETDVENLPFSSGSDSSD